MPKLLIGSAQLDGPSAASMQRETEPSEPRAEVDLERARDLRVDGRLSEAEAVIRAVLARQPRSASAYDHLGRTLLLRGRVSSAIAAFHRALGLDSQRAETHLELGLAYERRGAAGQAAECYEQAATLDPEWPLPAINLGILHLAEGRTPAAIARFRAAVDSAPGLSLAHQQLAYSLLQQGELEEGFRELEWRFDRGGETPCYPGTRAPVWDGRSRGDETLMIFCEQGYGTRIQFIRYAALAAQRVARVLCLAAGPEASLLATCPGLNRVYTPDEELPHFDTQLPLGSLPRVFDTRLETVPAQAPYLTVPAGVSVVDEVLSRDDGLRVGFVWASGEDYRGPPRDAPPEAFARLAAVEGVRLFSLQFDERRTALAQLDVDIIDLAPWLGDFAQTAAYVDRMDLIITVDTAMAHLAGALGKPVWLLLGLRAEWRWLEDRSDSPWYPTMRIIRQRHEGDWDEVFDRVERDLDRLASSRKFV